MAKKGKSVKPSKKPYFADITTQVIWGVFLSPDEV